MAAAAAADLSGGLEPDVRLGSFLDMSDAGGSFPREMGMPGPDLRDGMRPGSRPASVAQAVRVSLEQGLL